MNLFRSEEHVKNWSGFKKGTEEAILPLEGLMAIFKTPRHSAKFSGHYVSSAPEYAQPFFETIKQVTGNSSQMAISTTAPIAAIIPTNCHRLINSFKIILAKMTVAAG